MMLNNSALIALFALTTFAAIGCANILGFEDGIVAANAGTSGTGGSSRSNTGGTTTVGGSSGAGGTSLQRGSSSAGGSSATTLTTAAGFTSMGGTWSMGGAVNLGGSSTSSTMDSGGVIGAGGTAATASTLPAGGTPSVGGTAATGGGTTAIGGTSATTSSACGNTSTTIGAPYTCCVQEGAYGCAANASAHKVLCTNGLWMPNDDCVGDSLCDSRAGSSVGSCQPVIPVCEKPNEGTCDGQVAETCGPDRVSVTNRQTCSGATPICNAGKCTTCPTTGGPSMIPLPAPLNFCIDSTEVTRAQYQKWLDSKPDTSKQIDVCSRNTTFAPGPNEKWPPSTNTLDYPVGDVDWCDAYSYCVAVGKRLCGKLGGGSADYGLPLASQWFAACSSNGAATYPYGSTYSATTCNGLDAGNNRAAVAAASGMSEKCQSVVIGYTGIFDMSGNVAEWEDSCDPGGNCRLRGGSFDSDDADLRCAAEFDYPREASNGYVGFRCCFP